MSDRGCDFTMIVIGSGPAGESAAMNAVKRGKRCAVIEMQPKVGGNCTHKGTIPSKALRQSIKQLLRFSNNPLLSDYVHPRSYSFPNLKGEMKKVIQRQVDMRSRFYSRNGIQRMTGHARLVDEHSVFVTLSDGSEDVITGESIVIATGSRPYHPHDIDFNHPRIYDSDSILDMEHTPRKLLIYGAGVIGCEYASIFSGLRVKVDLINSRDYLLEFLDDEISDALSYHLRDTGVMVRHREEYSEVIADDKGITLKLKSGKKLRADAMLWCNGRMGNSDNMGLEALGIEPDHRGQLKVNNRYQTAIKNIYAVGDVVGWPSLASAAYNQGRSAAAAARGKESNQFVEDVATGIYTIPEISSVGRTEQELTAAKVPYEIGRAFFKDTARGQISGNMVGVLKLLFHPETHQILGIHCFGAEATEIIHIGQAIMNQPGENNTIDYFIRTAFNYPTMAEAYRIAALNGLNRLYEDG
ncbi:MAG: Si-specific NAD(P)(+) transhydrogenase [Pseudomonadales bacterium]|nr:Si-specific NAD(P)(+) transhydrogenase [Pseudomonadales bacterium]MCP5301882.1 Si-specific NAD(P)(+) transhydrogenase [Pseudomonadales bacterium]